jgi:hypothetical protein
MLKLASTNPAMKSANSGVASGVVSGSVCARILFENKSKITVTIAEKHVFIS